MNLPASAGRGFSSGYFDHAHLDQMATAASHLSGHARGVFFRLNPLTPSQFLPCSNQLNGSDSHPRDQDILCRKWLMIDIDPKRKSTVSATDIEKNYAWETMLTARDYLDSLGFPPPLLADSGNGYHIYYRVELSAESQLPHEILKCLNKRFSNDVVKIDTSVASANQLTKLFGTVSAKGVWTVDRPHRQSKLLDVPPTLEPISNPPNQ